MARDPPGWYGKLAMLGDFAQRRLPEHAVRRCDTWLSRAMAAGREHLAANWLDVYLSAPVLRFAWAPGVLDELWWFGVVMPSCDQVGRYFPLLVAQSRTGAPADRIALVRDGSPYRGVADLDQAGRRIAVGLKTAYDLYLTREIRHAALERVDGSPAAIERFVSQGLDAAAGVRQPLAAYAAAHPGLRVLAESFMVIRQAAAVPRGRPGAAAQLAAFVEEAKATGFVKRALEASGQGDVTVAPPAP